MFYQKQTCSFDKIFNRDEKEEPVTIKKEEPSKADKASLVYESKYSFSEYRNDGKYYNISFTTKYVRLNKFYHRLIDFRTFFSQGEANIKTRLCLIMLNSYKIHY